MASVRVVHAGFHTTVQDRGRWGHQSRGVPVAGAMDVTAHRLANALAGNGSSAATLEVTLTGPELEFDDEREVAVAGADFELTVDGTAVPLYARLHVSRGSRLRFGTRRGGARAYVAVSGGFDVPAVLGSRATHVGLGMGGFRGRALAAADRIALGPVSRRAHAHGAALSHDEAAALVRLPGAGRLRIVPGPEHDRFDREAAEELGGGAFTVSADSSRMGYRLEGPALRHVGPPDILSSATVAGLVQVPASGGPVLLMADRQTTGGYARIAAVVAADLDAAGQLAPGDAVGFEWCTRREALMALVAREQAMMSVEGRLVR